MGISTEFPPWQAFVYESVKMTLRRSRTALVALGANLPFEGHAASVTLSLAVKSMADIGLSNLTVSRLFSTPCFPAGAGPNYINAAALLQVAPHVKAADILQKLHLIEAMFGRQRNLRWGMRTLDLDLLALDDEVLPDPTTQSQWRSLDPLQQTEETPEQLILPHPRMQDRAFVLVPLNDVAPDWRHPLLQQTVAEMMAALPAASRNEIRPI